MDFSQLNEEDKVLAVQLLEKHRERQHNIANNFIMIVNDWCGLELTDEQHDKLWKLVEAEMDEDDLQRLSAPYIGTDTREGMMRVIANTLSGMDWPLYGDSDQDKEQFNTKMQAGLAKIGYTEAFSLD